MKVQNAAQKKVKKTDNYKEANNREDNFTDVRMYVCIVNQKEYKRTDKII